MSIVVDVERGFLSNQETATNGFQRGAKPQAGLVKGSISSFSINDPHEALDLILSHSWDNTLMSRSSSVGYSSVSKILGGVSEDTTGNQI